MQPLYQHLTPQIISMYESGVSSREIGKRLSIPRTCLGRIIRNHLRSLRDAANASAATQLHVMQLPRENGAIIPNHEVPLRGLWRGLERWRDLH